MFGRVRGRRRNRSFGTLISDSRQRGMKSSIPMRMDRKKLSLGWRPKITKAKITKLLEKAEFRE
jgi:hypothetical protein